MSKARCLDARASGTKRVVGWRRPNVCSLQRARHLPQMRSSITSRDVPSSSFVHGLELECFGRNSVTLHHIALVFRYRVLGTTPPRGGPAPAGENGSLLGKQSVVVLSEVEALPSLHSSSPPSRTGYSLTRQPDPTWANTHMRERDALSMEAGSRLAVSPIA